MEAAKLNYITPKYMEKFQCIGPACEDTCCSLWAITIDKATYDKYQRIPDKQTRGGIVNRLKRNDKNHIDYATFKMDKTTGHCPMLCDGLCSIQAKLGEEYLSQTCSTYPRVLNNVGGHLELSAQLSCPEAARLVLLSPDAMDFIEIDELSTPNLRIKGGFELTTEQNKCMKLMRDMVITVLKDKRFTFQHRLIMIGVFFDNINGPFINKSYDEVIKFIAEFRAEVETNEELHDYDAFPKDGKFQFQYLNNLLMDKLNDFLWNKRYRESIHEYLSGIQANGSTLEETYATYQSVCSSLYDPYMNENSFIMENYVLNHVYQSFEADLMNGEPPYLFFVKTVLDYALIRLHLVGMASNSGSMNDTMVVKLIQSYVKNYKFSDKFMNALADDLQMNGYVSLGFMSLLIK